MRGMVSVVKACPETQIDHSHNEECSEINSIIEGVTLGYVILSTLRCIPSVPIHVVFTHSIMYLESLHAYFFFYDFMCYAMA